MSLHVVPYVKRGEIRGSPGSAHASFSPRVKQA